MAKLADFVKTLGKTLNWVSIAALLVMVCITIIDVFLKQAFTAPVVGAVEITRMMMVCMTPSFVYALVENRHVKVGLFIDKLGKKGQLCFDAFGYLFSSLLCVLMCYQGFIEVGKKMAQNQVYTMLKIPTWPFFMIFAIAMGFFAFAIIVYLVEKYINQFGKNEGAIPEERAKA